jgi:hypothetical protein
MEIKLADRERHKSINILFSYIRDYESGHRFDTNEFINYFDNVLAHLKVVRDQNSHNIIRGVDEMLLTEFDKVPFTTPQGGTDVRYFAAHLLATAFPIMIPLAAQFQEAYRFCLKLRQNRADIDFLELELASHLFDRNLLRKSEKLRSYFLTKMAELQNLNNDPNILEDPAYQYLDKLETIPPPRLFLALRRRYLYTGSNQLIQNRQTPEFKLSEHKILSRLADANLIYHNLLLEMEYLKSKIPLWRRFRQAALNVFRFVLGIFRAPRYIWFVLTKCRGNFLFFIISLFLLIFFLIGVIKIMGRYQDKNYHEFLKRIEEVRK